MLFAEVVEYGLAASRRGVKRALCKLGCAVVVFHVVGKIMNWVMLIKRRNLGFSHVCPCAPALRRCRLYCWAFDFDKDQRHAVYQQGNVGAECFVAVDTRQLSYNVETVVVKILKSISFLPPD